MRNFPILPKNSIQKWKEESREIKDYSILLDGLYTDFGDHFCHSILCWCKLMEKQQQTQDPSFWEVWIVKQNNKTIAICGLYSLDNNIILFEQTNGNLVDFFKKNIFDPDIFKSLLFQILIGIFVMKKIMKTLNFNLTIKNILYKKIDKNIKYFKYTIDNSYFIVPTFGYIFMISNFDYAESILDKNNQKDIEDIEDINFGINYNYDFKFLSNLYCNIIKENIKPSITNLNDFKKYINKTKIDNIVKIYKFYKNKLNNNNKLNDNIKEQYILNILLDYCIQNNLFNLDNNNFIDKNKIPDITSINLINNIFNSKQLIDNLLFEYFIEYTNNNDYTITKENCIYFKTTVNIKYKNTLSRNLLNSKKSIGELIKKLYKITDLNYSTLNCYYLNTKNNYFPKFIKPMYDNIKPYDYIEPIKRLYKRFPSKYYKYLIDNYKFDSNSNNTKRLDFYDKMNLIDLDEIMLQYVKTRPNCFIITLWPIFSDWIDDTIKYLESNGNVYYKKIIDFKPRGLVNYLCGVYDEFSNNDVLKIALGKYDWIRLPDSKSNKIAIIIFDNVNDLKLAGIASKFKSILRDWALDKIAQSNINIDNIRTNDLLHINDFFYQTKEYCEMVLNSNSINLLNNRLYEKIYNNFYEDSRLKIETYRKSIYSNLNLETINSLFLISGTTLYFYGFRPLDDIDGICINYDNDFYNKNDNNSNETKKIIKMFCDKSTRIFYTDFGTINSTYWKMSWSKSNSIIANYFNITDFSEICWNPKYHHYHKGIKNYIIDFEFYNKIQRTDKNIRKNLWPTLIKDYNDYIMINYLQPSVIKNFIYVDPNGKLKVVDEITKIYPILKNLPFNYKTLNIIKELLENKYKPYINSNFNEKNMISYFK